MNTKRVLFVVYSFPPEGARGTKRSLKFIRYLPENRWSTVVLTVRSSPNYSFHDASLVAELPNNLVVSRARTLESLFHGKRHGDAEVCDPMVQAKKAPPPSPLRRAALFLYRGLGGIARLPDSRILWLPFA